MADFSKADFQRMIQRIRDNRDRYPRLAEMLLADMPEDYDPGTAQLSAGPSSTPDLCAQKLSPGAAVVEAEVVQLRATRASKTEAVNQARQLFMDEVRKLNERLLEGRPSFGPLQWQLEVRDLIKEVNAEAYAVGKSGKWKDMTFQDWGRAGQIMREQYRFLQGWVSEMYRGAEFSVAQLNARAQLYANAASQSLEKGTMSEIGLNPNQLPDFAGSGTTLCRANCKCRWSIKVLSKARGDFNATWRLGYAEHCRTCRQRARKWVKLRIRGGVLIDAPEPIAN